MGSRRVLHLGVVLQLCFGRILGAAGPIRQVDRTTEDYWSSNSVAMRWLCPAVLIRLAVLPIPYGNRHDWAKGQDIDRTGFLPVRLNVGPSARLRPYGTSTPDCNRHQDSQGLTRGRFGIAAGLLHIDPVEKVEHRSDSGLYLSSGNPTNQRKQKRLRLPELSEQMSSEVRAVRLIGA